MTRVLITNHSLAHRTGSELYVLELAEHLRERGREVALYAPVVGDLAQRARERGFAVLEDLDRSEYSPDVLHCQHRLESLTAVLRFPETPAAVLCHGFQPWQEVPVRFPSITAYAAVDSHTRSRMAERLGIEPDGIELILNGVDLRRFKPRAALPARPRKALLFSNTARPRGYSEAIAVACARHGIALEVFGLGRDAVVERPWELLPKFDLVFAKGRAALEALAVGAAVILCDEAGLGPMVEAADFDRLRPLNFGRTTFTEKVAADAVGRRIERYDAADTERVATLVRQHADAAATFAGVEKLHALAQERFASGPPGTASERALAASREVADLGPLLREREQLIDEVRHARHEESLIRADLAPALARAAGLEEELDRLRSAIER